MPEVFRSLQKNKRIQLLLNFYDINNDKLSFRALLIRSIFLSTERSEYSYIGIS